MNAVKKCARAALIVLSSVVLLITVTALIGCKVEEKTSSNGEESWLVDYIPSTYSISQVAVGDLNNDDRDDYVLMIEGKKDDTRRGIIIIFDEMYYNVVLENRNCLSYDDDDYYYDDGYYFYGNFEAAIKKGILEISRGDNMYGEVYKFRYQNSDFELIGYDFYDSSYDYYFETSVNLLSKKMQTIICTEDQTEKEEEWDDIIIKEPIKLRRIVNFYDFDIDEYIDF